MNGKQNSSFLPKDKKKPFSDSKRSREKENDDSSPSISHQLKKVLPVIKFNDCKGSLSGKLLYRISQTQWEALKKKAKLLQK